MISSTKIITFCAAHRLLGHKGRCRFLHGHNYKVEVTAEPSGETLTDLDMVVDFSIIKGILGKWIDDRWDHALLLNSNDPMPIPAEVGGSNAARCFIFPERNPTAEVMALHLLHVCENEFEAAGAKITSVTVWETDSSFSTAAL